MAVNLMMQNSMYGSFRWPWISELYEYVQSVHLLPAVVSTMLHPRKPTFNVTAKDESIAESRVSEIGLPFYVIFAVLLLGLVATVWRVIDEPYRADLTMVVGAWNVLNLVIAGCALGVVSELGTPTANRRIAVKRRCDIQIEGTLLAGTIEDVSVSGVSVRVTGALPPEVERGTSATLRVRTELESGRDTIPLVFKRIQRGEGSTVLGCAFAADSAHHNRLIVDLIFADSGNGSSFSAPVGAIPAFCGARSGSSACASTRRSEGWAISCAASAASQPRKPSRRRRADETHRRIHPRASGRRHRLAGLRRRAACALRHERRETRRARPAAAAAAAAAAAPGRPAKRLGHDEPRKARGARKCRASIRATGIRV